MANQYGEYIHYHKSNYKLFGNTRNRPSATAFEAQRALVRQNINTIARNFSKDKKAPSLQKLEDFLTDIVFNQNKNKSFSDAAYKNFVDIMDNYIRTYFHPDASFSTLFNLEQIDLESNVITKNQLQQIQNKLKIVTKKTLATSAHLNVDEAEMLLIDVEKQVNNLLIQAEVNGVDYVNISKNLDLISKINQVIAVSSYPSKVSIGQIGEAICIVFNALMQDAIEDQIDNLFINKVMKTYGKNRVGQKLTAGPNGQFQTGMIDTLRKNAKMAGTIRSKNSNGFTVEFVTKRTQQKCDLIISVPEISGFEALNTSIKTYGGLQNLEIVNNKPLLTLLTTINPDIVNHWLNHVAIATNSNDEDANKPLPGWETSFEIVKLGMAAAALTGAGAEYGLADSFIIIDTGARRVHVRTMGEALSQLEKSLDNNTKINNLIKMRNFPNTIENNWVGEDKNSFNSASARIANILVQLQRAKIVMSVNLKGIRDDIPN